MLDIQFASGYYTKLDLKYQVNVILGFTIPPL